MREHKIGAICVCGSELKLNEYKEIKVQTRMLKIVDTANQNIIDVIPETVEWIREMRGKDVNVFVHCMAGVSRSASICIAYLMAANKIPYEVAHVEVKKKRKCIKPNPNFIRQLKQYG